MSNEIINDWPESIARPALPEGYEWVCLQQALGVRAGDSNHSWWIRVRWTIRNGKKRFIRMRHEYFATPQAAIACAIGEVKCHAEMRRRKL